MGWWRLSTLGLLLLFSGLLPGDDSSRFWPDPAFQWGERKFSRNEAERIVALAPESPQTVQEARDLVRQQLPLLAGIVLCERAGIGLSAEDTLAAAKLEILMLSPEEQKRFLLACRRAGVDSEALLRKNAFRIDRQFQNAIRQWYRKEFSDEATVSDEQVRDWYFRHQDRFLTVEIEPDAVFVLPDTPDAPVQAVAWLKQGMPAAAVRKKFPEAATDESIRSALLSTAAANRPEAGFALYRGDGFQVMTRAGAVRKTYCKLTPELTEAIRNVLYDALARARLAERLEAETARYELIFF